MDLNLLKAFTTLAMTRNLTRTAELLHLSQPALSLQIKQLESRIGAPLFERHPWRLTDTGEHLLSHAQDMLSRWDDVLAFVQDEQSLQQGRLTIACSDTLMRHFLVKPLKQFQKKRPNLRLSVVNRTSESAKQAVLSGEADLALAVFSGEPNKLVHRPFLTYHDVAVVPADHPFNQKERLSARQLQNETLLLLEEKTMSRQRHNRWFTDKNVTVSHIMSLGSVEAQLALVKAGLGVAIVPEFSVPANMKRLPISGLNAINVGWFYQRLKPASQAWFRLLS